LELIRNYKENSQYIYQDVLAKKIDIIDPAFFVAKELYEYLLSEELLNNGNIYDSEFYISVPNVLNENIRMDEKGNFEYDYKYGREVNDIQEYVKRVPFNSKNISESIVVRLKEKIPYTYSLISNFNLSNSKTEYLLESEKLK
jgi:hypothetical protein